MPEAEVATPSPAAPAAPIKGRYEIPVLADQTVASPSTPAPAEPVDKTEQNIEAEATPAKPEAKPEPELTPAEAEAKRNQRRIDRKFDKAHRQRAEAQAKADFLEKRLAELEKAQAPKAPEGEPTLEKFDFDPEKYATAKAEYAKTQAAKEFTDKQRTESQQKAHHKLVSDWEEKIAAAEDGEEEIDPRAAQMKPVSPLAEAIMGAENGVQIFQYLLKNPKEDTRIGALSAVSQVREIGKLEAKLLSEPAKPKTPSKAPAPITPLTGAATISTGAPSESDDYATWFKKRNKQVHGR